MKKIILLLMAVTVCLSLTACRSEKTKERMLSQAIEVHAADVNSDTLNNLAKAKMAYCDKTLKLKGWVYRIHEDYIEIGFKDCVVDVYLPTEDIVTLSLEQQVTVVGKTKGKIKEIEEAYAGYVFQSYHYQMPNAYLVNDRIETTILYDGKNSVLINGHYFPLMWNESVDTSQYVGKTCLISAKYKNKGSTGIYYDAVVLEIID